MRRTLRDHQEHTRKQLDAALRDQVLTDSDHGALLTQLQGVDLRSEDVAGQLRTIGQVGARIADAQRARSEELRAEAAEHALDEEDRRRIDDKLAAGELASAAEHLARLRAGESGGAQRTGSRPSASTPSRASWRRTRADNLVELLQRARAATWSRPPSERSRASSGTARRSACPSLRGQHANLLLILATLGLL